MKHVMSNRIKIETNDDDEMTPKDVAQRIADLVMLFAETELTWLAEHGYEFDINVYDDDEPLVYTMIKPQTRDVFISEAW